MNRLCVFDTISNPVPKTKTTPDKKYSNEFKVLNVSLHSLFAHKIAMAVYNQNADIVHSCLKDLDPLKTVLIFPTEEEVTNSSGHSSKFFKIVYNNYTYDHQSGRYRKYVLQTTGEATGQKVQTALLTQDGMPKVFPWTKNKR